MKQDPWEPIQVGIMHRNIEVSDVITSGLYNSSPILRSVDMSTDFCRITDTN